MDFAPVYLLWRFVYRIFEFFHHWYVDGSRLFAHKYISVLERADEIFAVKITLRYFFHPLYKDYTVIGRILGVIFRTLRIAAGLVAYILISAIFIVVYVAWVAIPFLILIYAARELRY